MENIDNLAVESLEQSQEQNIIEDYSDISENNTNNNDNNNDNNPKPAKKKFKLNLTRKTITIGAIALAVVLAVVIVTIIVLGGSGAASFYNKYTLNDYITLSGSRVAPNDVSTNQVNAYDDYGNGIVVNISGQTAVYNFISDSNLINWQDKNIHCLFDGMYALVDSNDSSLYDIYYNGGVMEDIPASRVFSGDRYVLDNQGNMVYINPHDGKLVTVPVTNGITPKDLDNALVLDKYYVVQDDNVIKYYDKDFKYVATHNSNDYKKTASGTISTFVLSNGNAVYQMIYIMPEDTGSRGYDYTQNETKYNVETYIYNVAGNKVSKKNVDFVIEQCTPADVVEEFIIAGQLSPKNIAAVRYFDNKLLESNATVVGLNNGLNVTADLDSIGSRYFGMPRMVGEGLYAISNSSGDMAIFNNFGRELHTFIDVAGMTRVLYNRGVFVGDSLYSFEGELIAMYESIEYIHNTSFIYTVETKSSSGYVTNYYLSTGEGDDIKIDGYNGNGGNYYSTVTYSSNTYTIKIYSMSDGHILLVDYTSTTSGNIVIIDSAKVGNGEYVDEYVLVKVGDEAYFRINMYQ